MKHTLKEFAFYSAFSTIRKRWQHVLSHRPVLSDIILHFQHTTNHFSVESYLTPSSPANLHFDVPSELEDPLDN